MHRYNGRARRPSGGESVQFQVRTEPRIRTLVADAAASSGVTVSLYMTELLERLVAENGGTMPTLEFPELDAEGGVPSRPAA